MSRLDEIYLEEARRIVSRDEHGEVSADKRLVQEEYAAALITKESRARARVLTKLSAIAAAEHREKREFENWVLTCKTKYEELFHQAEVTRTLPPDVAHPAHIDITPSGLVINGPIARADRRLWEELKGSIKIAAWLHARARERWRRNPTAKNTTELRDIEAHRRRLMRQVPPGWNWQENIYCRSSQSEFVRKTINQLEAVK